MELYNITPDRDLGEFLIANGVKDKIYFDFDRPTSNLPDTFIEIIENGATQRIASNGSVYKCTLALTINVKLLSSGSKNIKKESSMLKSIVTALKKQNRYSIAPFVMFKGKSIEANYSFKTINIITYKY